MPTNGLPANPTAGTYYAIQVRSHPGHWEVMSWQDGEWVFLQGFPALDAEAEANAKALASYMNAGGC